MRKILIFIFFIFCSSAFYHSQTIRNFNVVLRSNFGSDTMWDNLEVPIYSMNSSLSAEPNLPAKVIYCNEGDSVVLNALSLAQGEHHTIHLHGLDVDTRNDGDPMTSFWLEHLQDTTYSFKATHAGTYLYHCHVADVVHVQMGMYGLVIVKAANGLNTAWTGGPAYDKEVHWLMSELDASWHFNVPSHDPIVDTVNIPPYQPTYFLVNGKSEWQLDNNDSIRIDAVFGSQVYVRLANIGFYANKIIFPSILSAKIIDSDGRPLPNAVVNDTVVVQPGERYGVMLSANAMLDDSIPIHFVNMNTGITENTQWAPIHIHSTIGIKEIEKQFEVKVFPNPFIESLFISSSERGEHSVIVKDVSGKIVDCFRFKGNEFVYQESLLQKGIYFFEIKSQRDAVKTIKIIRF